MAGDRSNARIEESVARLESVGVCHLVTGPGRRLQSLDIVAQEGWLLDTVRRDVQATLFQNFDLNVPDHLINVRSAEADTVRAADAASREPTPSVGPGPDRVAAPTGVTAQPTGRAAPAATIERERLVLDTVHLALRSHGTSVGVDLLDGEERLRGKAGPVGPTGVLAGVVEATIDAMGDRITHSLSTVVAEIVEAGGDQIAIATVTASDGRSRQRLTGSAIVRGNLEDAMARATLDATNRLLLD